MIVERTKIKSNVCISNITIEVDVIFLKNISGKKRKQTHLDQPLDRKKQLES